jgi:glycosyltransferase involved in cell wall biosynthesis
MNNSYPSVAAICINSRGGHLFQECMESLQDQRYPGKFEVIVIENFKRKKSIGQCWNEGVKQSNHDLCFFVGDDDTINGEMVFVLVNTIQKAEETVNQIAGVSTFVTVFDEKNEGYQEKTHTGMFYRKHLLKYPFDETLKKLVDRKYIEHITREGFAYIINPFYYGYRYRQHTGKTAGKYQLHEQENIDETDIYFLYDHNHFIDPIADALKIDGYNIKKNDHFSPRYAKGAKLVWAEFAGKNAQVVADSDLPGKKICRLHAFEAFGPALNEIKYSKFDKVIFVSDYIREYCEKRIGKMDNAVTIPNGVDLKKFTISPNKERNNKIAVAGYLANKKGSHMLIMLANEFPGFEFHVVGTFQELDVYDLFQRKRPKNMFLYPWTTDLNDFYADKTYILNTSPRESQCMSVMEGMAAGLKPLVLDWVGADKIYGQYVWKTVKEFAVLLSDVHPGEYRKFIKNNYSFEIMIRRIKKVVKECLAEQKTQPESLRPDVPTGTKRKYKNEKLAKAIGL